MVTVKYTSKLRVDLGREKDRVQAKTVADLIAELDRRYGHSFTGWMPSCKIFLNGSSLADRKGQDTALADGDEIVFLLPVAGG